MHERHRRLSVVRRVYTAGEAVGQRKNNSHNRLLNCVPRQWTKWKTARTNNPPESLGDPSSVLCVPSCHPDDPPPPLRLRCRVSPVFRPGFSTDSFLNASSLSHFPRWKLIATGRQLMWFSNYPEIKSDGRGFNTSETGGAMSNVVELRAIVAPFLACNWKKSFWKGDRGSI